MNQKNNYLLLLMIVMSCTTSFSQKAKLADSPAGHGITVTHSQVPLLKNVAFNQLMKMTVYVPYGKNIQYKYFQLQLNETAVKSIEKINVIVRDERERNFLTGATTYATINSLSTALNIPVNLPLHQGWNTIWFGAALKANADIDKKLLVNIKSITTGAGYVHSFSSRINSTTNKAEGRYSMGVAIRKAWDDSVHTYRIPGITTTGKGTLIAVYDIRYKHGGDLPANIDVGMSRSSDGGRTWESMKKIMDMGEPHENNGVGDPAILFDPATKKIWVAALWSKGNRSIAGSKPGLSPDTTGQLVLVSSDDDGLTWSQPYSITEQVKNPAWHLYFNGPGNGIVMKNGTLVFPSQYWDETTKPASVGIPHSSIIYSEDQGKTWKSGNGAKSNTTESQVVETTPGTLMLNMRDNRGKFRSVATTTDMGKTWIEHPTSYSALPDPVCMAGFTKAMVNVKGQMKEVLFFSNVASQTTRNNTTIKASLDLGETWQNKNQVLLDERPGYGYSALTKIDDNTIGIIYEGERDLYFLRVPVSDIIK